LKKPARWLRAGTHSYQSNQRKRTARIQAEAIGRGFRAASNVFCLFEESKSGSQALKLGVRISRPCAAKTSVGGGGVGFSKDGALWTGEAERASAVLPCFRTSESGNRRARIFVLRSNCGSTALSLQPRRGCDLLWGLTSSNRRANQDLEIFVRTPYSQRCRDGEGILGHFNATGVITTSSVVARTKSEGASLKRECFHESKMRRGKRSRKEGTSPFGKRTTAGTEPSWVNKRKSAW